MDRMVLGNKQCNTIKMTRFYANLSLLHLNVFVFVLYPQLKINKTKNRFHFDVKLNLNT